MTTIPTKPIPQTSITSTATLISVKDMTAHPIFEWVGGKGEITHDGFQSHWLSQVQGDGSREAIKSLATNSYLLLPRTPPWPDDRDCGHSQIGDGRWKILVLNALFPVGSLRALDYLFVWQVPDELSIESDDKMHPPNGPDLLYSLTSNIFSSQDEQTRRTGRLHVLTGQLLTVPYLSVFLDSSMDVESRKVHASAWATYLLEARVKEWCRASNLQLCTVHRWKLDLKTSSTKRQGQEKTMKKSLTPRYFATKVEAARQEPGQADATAGVSGIFEKVVYYCILLNRKCSTVWRFQAILKVLPSGIDWQETSCNEFVRDCQLAERGDWKDLANQISGMHLEAAIHGGKLIKKIQKSRLPNTTATDSFARSAEVNSLLDANDGWRQVEPQPLCALRELDYQDSRFIHPDRAA